VSRLRFTLIVMLGGFIGGCLMGLYPIVYFHFSEASLIGYASGIVVGQLISFCSGWFLWKTLYGRRSE